MKNSNKKYFLSFFILLIIFLGQVAFISNIHAGSLWESQEGMSGADSIGEAFGETAGTPRDVRTIVGNVIKVFLTFIGIIFVILILLAGYKWMTSQGNENTIGEAKSQIKSSIIGLAIIISAYAITTFVAIALEDSLQ
ncbi:MAG: pilin [Candidatus Falkowbacteria bacterium]